MDTSIALNIDNALKTFGGDVRRIFHSAEQYAKRTGKLHRNG